MGIGDWAQSPIPIKIYLHKLKKLNKLYYIQIIIYFYVLK